MSEPRPSPAPLPAAAAPPTLREAARRRVKGIRVDLALWTRARERMRARGDRSCEVMEWALRAYLQATEAPCDGDRRATRSRRK